MTWQGECFQYEVISPASSTCQFGQKGLCSEAAGRFWLLVSVELHGSIGFPCDSNYSNV